jgi:hypothetical protein
MEQIFPSSTQRGKAAFLPVELQADYLLVKRQLALEVRHGQVDAADPRGGVDGGGLDGG